MFPIGDENGGQRLRPFVNWSLIAINIVVFLYEVVLSEAELARFIGQWGAVPAEISEGRQLETLVTSEFLHGGWLHLGGNMLFLWVFGDNVEDVMGHVAYLAFYLATGVVAAFAQVIVNPDSMVPLVGASGAIAGVMAAYVVLFPGGLIKTVFFLWIIPFVFLIPAWIQIGLWLFTQFINGFLAFDVVTRETSGGGVAYFAHIGGFLSGAAFVLFFRNSAAHRRQKVAREHTRAFQRMQMRQRQVEG